LQWKSGHLKGRNPFDHFFDAAPLFTLEKFLTLARHRDINLFLN
jgi:hypothetical protein